MPAASMNALRSRIPNMVRASDFDPSQGPATFMDPRVRHQQLLDSYEVNPGRAPGGSGTTGLQSMDKRGYSDMLNERLEFMRLDDLMSGGRGEVDVRADPRSNRRSSFEPLDYYRGPDRDFFATGAGRPGSALGALKERSARPQRRGGVDY
jgi:hypothetical protein